MLERLIRLQQTFDQAAERLSPLFLLLLRLYVASVFFKSGLVKLGDLDATVALFESEYRVPLLSPVLAAYSGTAAELLLPALFAAGLLSRPVALAFFVFNVVAVVSYPDISPAGIKDHAIWGLAMLVVLCFGAGRFSLDALIQRRFASQAVAG